MASKFDVSKDRKFKAIKAKQVKTVVDDRFLPLFKDPRFTKIAKRDIYGRGLREVDNDEDPTSMLILRRQGKKNKGSKETMKSDKKKATEPTVFSKRSDEHIKEGKAGECSEGGDKDINEVDDESVNEGNDRKTSQGVGNEKADNNNEEDENDTNEGDASSEKFVWDESSTSSSEDDGEREALKARLATEVWDSHASEIEHGDATSRIALLGCDWENIDATDILVLCHSILGGTLDHDTRKSPVIHKVTIYPSKFGHERLQEEIATGPKLEDLEAIEALKKQRDDEDAEIEEEVMLAIRKYQKERSQYMYAVIECESVEVSDQLYNELDSMDVDFAIDGLDLRFVPNDLVDFPFEPSSTATFVPEGYQPPMAFFQALKHSRTQLEWDAGPKKREKILRKRFTAQEMAALDLQEYLASASASDGSESDAGEARVALLGDLANQTEMGADTAIDTATDVVGDQAEISDDDFFVSADDKGVDSSLRPVALKRSKKAFPLIGCVSSDDSAPRSGLVARQHKILEENTSSDDGDAVRRKHKKKQKKRRPCDKITAAEPVELDDRFAPLKQDSRFCIDGTHPALMNKKRKQK